MRTFWLGLAVVAMAAATWASDAADTPDVEVGDWVMTKTTSTVNGKPIILMTSLKKVKAIDGKIVTLDTKTTIRPADMTGTPSDGGETHAVSNEGKVHFWSLNSAGTYRDQDEDGVKIEVLEEGRGTVEVNGMAFEDAFYQKVKITVATKDDGVAIEEMIEVWIDDKAPALARPLKTVTIGVTTGSQGGRSAEIGRTMERVAYGRADDPIPEDEISGDGGDAPQQRE